MSSVEEDAFFASRRASSCSLKGMFFIVEGHVLERRWVCTLLQTLSGREWGT